MQPDIKRNLALCNGSSFLSRIQPEARFWRTPNPNKLWNSQNNPGGSEWKIRLGVGINHDTGDTPLEPKQGYCQKRCLRDGAACNGHWSNAAHSRPSALYATLSLRAFMKIWFRVRLYYRTRYYQPNEAANHRNLLTIRAPRQINPELMLPLMPPSADWELQSWFLTLHPRSGFVWRPMNRSAARSYK